MPAVATLTPSRPAGRAPGPVAGGRRVADRGRSCAPPQDGIALVIVLWLTVLLAVIASGFAYSMRGEALAARNTMSLAQARAAADGAVERTLFEMFRPRNLADAWIADGLPHAWKDGDIEVATTVGDESGRIDINFAADPLLKGLLQNVGGLDPEAAQRVLEAILDWRDADELRRPNGAEAPDYRAAGLKQVPTNMRFESTGELARVLGVTPALLAKIADSITVYSRQRGINPAVAPRDVLLALPGITPEQVDAFIAARAEALANRRPVPPFALAQSQAQGQPQLQIQGLFSAGTVAWRIHAEARAPDGVTFVRDAVVSAQLNPRRPVSVLLWQEGAPGKPPESPPANEPATHIDGTNKG